MKRSNDSPSRPVVYNNNGTGRDSYIASDSGGFTSNFGKFNPTDAYKRSLRDYDVTIQMAK